MHLLTSLSLYEDLLGPGETCSLPAGIRILYVASGEASSLRANEAWFGTDEIELEAGDEGATILRWELTEWAPTDAKLVAHVDLDPWEEYVMRCERVGVAVGEPVELGPPQGIACLLSGEFRIGDQIVGPFGAWVEPAGQGGSETQGTALVRVSLTATEGESSGGELLAEERVRL